MVKAATLVDEPTETFPLPCVISYWDDGRRFGIFFKRGRDLLHIINGEGLAGQAVHIHKLNRLRGRGWKLHTLALAPQECGPPALYPAVRAAQVFLQSGELRGVTDSAKIVLLQLVNGKPALVNEQVNETGDINAMGTQSEVVIEPNLKKYKEVVAKSGRKSLDNGDEIAKLLRGKSLEDAYAFTAKKLDVSERSLKEKYGKLNEGMQRMNLGNRLRGLAGAKAREAVKAAKKSKAK